eukprot:m.62336 g.62336  ORF g.62336 m.62336 type:complete len:162 (-) comp7132_c0_seq1:87-572(-)
MAFHNPLYDGVHEQGYVEQHPKNSKVDDELYDEPAFNETRKHNPVYHPGDDYLSTGADGYLSAGDGYLSTGADGYLSTDQAGDPGYLESPPQERGVGLTNALYDGRIPHARPDEDAYGFAPAADEPTYASGGYLDVSPNEPGEPAEAQYQYAGDSVYADME